MQREIWWDMKFNLGVSENILQIMGRKIITPAEKQKQRPSNSWCSRNKGPDTDTLIHIVPYTWSSPIEFNMNKEVAICPHIFKTDVSQGKMATFKHHFLGFANLLVFNKCLYFLSVFI